jgi:hypothetical protein
MSRVRSLALVLAGALVGALAVSLPGGSAAPGAAGAQSLPVWWNPPADVQAMLQQVNSESLERYDKTLVGFGTRHTASSQTDPVRGIGAARDWIFNQFNQIAATSGGRMSVAKQTSCSL